MLFLTSLPLWLSACIVIGIPTILSMLVPALARRCFNLESLRGCNEVAGFKYGTLGTIYAVVLGFAVVVTWQNYSEAENIVAQEAGAAASVYRLASGLGPQQGRDLRNSMTRYLRIAVAQDWPAMEDGKANAQVRDALDDIYTKLFLPHEADLHKAVVLSEILRQLDVVTQSRRGRLVKAAGLVPSVIWTMLFAGAVWTIVFTFFFSSDNPRLQTLLTGMLAALMFGSLLTIVSINCPFTGPIKVGPEPLLLVLGDFG